MRILTSSPMRPEAIFDRTPLDYLAYMAAIGADPSEEASTAAVQPAFGNLDLLVIMPITPETERLLPAAEMPGLRSQMNDALLELVYGDPLNAWGRHPRAGAERAARPPAGRGPRHAGPGPASGPPPPGALRSLRIRASCGG